jgi:hypothetical protein
MGYVHGETIKQIESSDQKQRIDIVARNDGTFQYYEHLLIAPGEGNAWTVGRVSGLYDSAEKAETAANEILASTQ